MFTISQLYDAKIDLIIRSLNHNVLRDFSFAKFPNSVTLLVEPEHNAETC